MRSVIFWDACSLTEGYTDDCRKCKGFHERDRNCPERTPRPLVASERASKGDRGSTSLPHLLAVGKGTLAGALHFAGHRLHDRNKGVEDWAFGVGGRADVGCS